VEAFEAAFAEYVGRRHAVGVGTGTDAVALALRAAGVGPGDEVVVPSLTAHGTAAAVMMIGARPRYADVDPSTRVITPVTVEPRLSRRVTAVVAVHLHGHPAPTAALRRQCDRHGLLLVEDAAQAHGTRDDSGTHVGGDGHAAAFSFYPTKTLGAPGDGGAVVTDDGAVASQLRRLRNYGWDDDRVAVVAGTNSRLDEIHAAALRVLLPHLDAAVRERRELARRYRAELAGAPIGQPPEATGAAYHQFVVTVRHRDRVRQHLADAGIGTAIHYPLGLHHQPGLAEEAPIQLPVTDELCRTMMSLPIQPEVARDHLEKIAATLLGIVEDDR
jgi:dTDP-3-amino-3,4,6-trideoxy-alpha-D-glucose transaminase